MPRCGVSPLLRLLAVLSVVVGTAALPTPVAAATATATAPSGAARAAAAAAEPTAGQSTYVPRTPVRLLDTRATGEPLGPGVTRSLRVAGVQGVPAAATAVALSVTVLGPTEATAVEVTPTAQSAGTTSLVVAARGTAAGLVTVAVGPDGSVVLRNERGSVQVVVDLSGHYAEGAGAGFVPATPSRLLDTRETRTPLGAQQVRTLQVAGGTTRVPAGATAVALNVTAVGATRSTDVRVYPAGPGAPPFVSNSNPGPGRPTSVLAVAGVGRDGAVSLFNAAGSVHLVVDLQGWFVPLGPGAGQASDERASVFHPLAPRRVLDTTVTGPAIGARGTRDVLVAGPGAVPAQATGVALTLTAVGATASTDVRVYPVPADGTSLPPSSNLNPGLGKDVSAGALVAVGRDGSVRLRNEAGAVHLRVDLSGWFGPPGLGADISWPQCTTAGATTTRTPSGAAFAIVGLNRGRPFTDNECFAAQWAWASSLPGEPAVYVNIDAAGASAPQWTTPGPRPCSGATLDPGCAFDYGYALAQYDAARLPTTPRGGKPFVWFDVEGGKAWQTGTGAVAVNRAALDGAAQGLRDAGYAGRYGIYTDAEPRPRNDWVQIMGEHTLPQLPLWVFASTNTGSRELCVAAADSITRGPVQAVQLRPAQSGQAFDVDDLC